MPGSKFFPKGKLNYADKKYLDDAIMTSIAGLSAAIKNTG